MKILNQRGVLDPRLIVAIPGGVILAIMCFFVVIQHIPKWLKWLVEAEIIITETPRFDFIAYYGTMFHSWQFWIAIIGLVVLLFISWRMKDC